jgi:hypothetical protein
MKRLLCVLGMFGLFAVGQAVVASSPAAAAGSAQIHNEGPVDLTVTAANTACDPVTTTVRANSTRNMSLDSDCVYRFTAVGKCVVETYIDDGWRPTNMTALLAGDTVEVRFRGVQSAETCLSGNLGLEIDKDVPDADDAAGQLTTFTFDLTPSSDSCTAAQTIDLVGGEGTPDLSMKIVQVVSSYIDNNSVMSCKYTVAENVPMGWAFSHFDVDEGSWSLDEAAAKATLDARASLLDDGRADINFWNDLEDVPIYVDKTYEGRDYYTTVDRSDFHLWLPGHCGQVPVDPSGGLLGSAGIFRTINASQEAQVVWALPDSIVAADGPRGPQPCTIRLQENNMPEGCTASDADGEDADGPYWEQTWVPNETTAFVFLVVNECAEPVPEPTPTASPTAGPQSTDAKKGHSMPSGGGSTAPKFTG